MRIANCCRISIALALLCANAARADKVAPSAKTATVAAGARYDGSGVKRFFMGDTYRDLWKMPITVPVLDLHAYAGGLKPTKISKGNQTKSLRFKNPAGLEYAFRLVDKYKINAPEGWENTIMGGMARDQVSAQHPAGAVIADGFYTAAQVLHPTPKLVVMPDDPALGKYRKDFAGKLGWIEAYPNVPERSGWIAGAGNDVAPRATGFAGAIAIIDSDSLQVLLDASPHERVDERAYLRARLTDMFLNDWDRHPGNWKWGRMKPGARWQPISRDRDKVLVSYGGVAALSGKFVPELVKFSATYPSMHSLTIHSLDLDRRLLSGLDRDAFDSTAVWLQSRFTDAVIEQSLRAMPAEYHYTIPATAAILRARREELRDVATEFYRYLSPFVDIHASDEADRAVVTLIDKERVDVEIRTGDAPPYFRRRFNAADTREIRLYVHDGDDNVVVRGDARPRLRVRIIGGNGHNRIIDTRGDDTDRGAVRMYDQGVVTDVQYGPNKIKTENADDEPNFDRRPWMDFAGQERELRTDRGQKIQPVASLEAPGDLGLVPGVGISRVRYGFRAYPYTSRIEALGEYATGVDGYRVTIDGDRRWESSPLHVMAIARMSDLEVLNFYGYGNDTAGGPDEEFEVTQRQWLFHPALAYALGTRSDVALGPVIQYSTTEDAAGTVLDATHEYGAGDFGQAGLRIGLYSDSRDRSEKPHRRIRLDLTATAYPAMWDVRSPYTVLNAFTATYLTMPVPVHPVLALRAGGRKVYGDQFPFHDAAFIGGRATERDLARERYAGDASLYGTAELRVPISHFTLLLPFNTGAYLYGDAGRVYMDGDSPGGWHTTKGVGAWIGILSPAAALCVEGDPSTGDFNARIGLSF
jgi:hypothetical protein